ncbi:MAG TPA: DUF4276 family protein [Planctomycetaceae bacterium]|nr:DUF4276 family protein [Planctomycetaceae bacterium]
MKELYVFCEGQTEQGFCNRVLQPHFFPQHDGMVHPIRIAHSRSKGRVSRGGVNKYQIIKDDILRSLSEHQRPHVLFTSFIDLYALPHDFPGFEQNTRNPDYPRPFVEALEAALQADIPDTRFVAYLQLHEFETLLFADPSALRISYDNIEAAVTQLSKMAKEAGDIEKINDTKDIAPSKRIIQQIPHYEGDKTTVGPDVAEFIGMEKLKIACEHFRDWVTTIARRLQQL